MGRLVELNFLCRIRTSVRGIGLLFEAEIDSLEKQIKIVIVTKITFKYMAIYF